MALNRKKTRVSFRGGRQAVTGLVVNERPGIPREYKRRLRQEIYQYRKFGLPGTETDSEKYRARLLGKIRYVLSVQPEDAWFAQADRELRAGTSDGKQFSDTSKMAEPGLPAPLEAEPQIG